MADVANDVKVVVSHTGAAESFTVTGGGALTFKMWGGAGSGAAIIVARQPGYGGPGGFVTGVIPVSTGDTIVVETGGGGRNVGAIGSSAGIGGWPDGGAGSYQGSVRTAGSGGGSSRIYKNGVLVAVAGAGGGANTNEDTPASRGYGGAGGGLSGVSGEPNGAWRGAGGTQSAGGVNLRYPADAVSAGGYLRGGSGGSASSGPEVPDAGAGVKGAGGGGGYYGGGGSSGLATTNSSGAGGGSSYTAVSVILPETEVGTAANPPRMSDPDYQAGIAVGSANSHPSTQAAPGGNGLVTFIIESTIPVLPEGTTTVTYSGDPVTYAITEDGGITFKMWGGAGSGAGIIVARQPGYGGPGGFVTGVLPVAAGDTIVVETGGGGRNVGAIGSAPGIGGWPDGGIGSYQTSVRTAGSGGGSSRIYKNGVLVAVAGAGGGAGTNEDTVASRGYGGSGGGLTGASGEPNGAWRGTGGTQTAGGVNSRAPTDTVSAGGYLRGGSGGSASSGPEVPDAGAGVKGAGGGGGYYGGGGSSGLATTNSSGAGGGSSYTASEVLLAATEAGTAANPARMSDPDYVAGVAVGSPNSHPSTQAGPGGNGLVVLDLGPLSIPADVVVPGLIGLVTATTPAGSAVGGRSGSGPLPTMAVVPTDGIASLPIAISRPLPDPVAVTAPLLDNVATAHNVSGDIPQLTFTQYVTGGAIAAAYTNTNELLLLPVTGVDTDISLITAAANKDVAMPPAPQFWPMQAAILGNADGLFAAFDVIAVEGEGDAGLNIQADLPDAVLIEYQGGVGWRFGDPEGKFDYDILIGTVFGQMQSGAVVDEPLPVIPISPLDGEGDTGPWYEGEPIPPVMLVDVIGNATGAAVGVEPVSENRRISVEPPEPFPEGSADFVGMGFPNDILLSTPQAIVDLAAYVLSFIAGPIMVVPAEGMGNRPGLVLTLLPEVFVDAPWGYADDSKPGKLRFKRTQTPGRTPDALMRGETVMNENDGVLYHRGVSGEIARTPVQDIMDGFSISGGAAGQVRNGVGDWVQPEPTYVDPVLGEPQSGRILLSDAPGATTLTAPGAGRIVYHPFFLTREHDITHLSVVIDTPAASTVADIGVCHWDPMHGPGEMISKGNASCAVAGVSRTAVPMTLPAGRYAAAIQVTGAGAPVFAASAGDQTLGFDFAPVGDPSGSAQDGFGAQITGREPLSIAYISAEVA